MKKTPFNFAQPTLAPLSEVDPNSTAASMARAIEKEAAVKTAKKREIARGVAGAAFRNVRLIKNNPNGVEAFNTSLTLDLGLSATEEAITHDLDHAFNELQASRHKPEAKKPTAATSEVEQNDIKSERLVWDNAFIAELEEIVDTRDKVAAVVEKYQASEEQSKPGVIDLSAAAEDELVRQ